MNKIILTGRIGNDLKLEGDDENKRCSFPLAVERRKGVTDWFNCTAWRQSANIIYNWCEKGSMITVAGRMESFKKEDGSYWWNVNVENITLCGDSKKKEESKKEQIDTSKFGKPNKDFGFNEDDLPF